MADFLELPKGIKFLNPVQSDERYGPWNSLAEAKTNTLGRRVRGLKIGVLESSNLVEYWFKNGVTDNDLTVFSNDENTLNWSIADWQDSDTETLNFNKVKELPETLTNGIFFQKLDGSDKFKLYIVDNLQINSLDVVDLNTLGNYYTKIETDNILLDYATEQWVLDQDYITLDDIETPSLQQVTDIGNSTTNSIISNGGSLGSGNNYSIMLGGSTPSFRMIIDNDAYSFLSNQSLFSSTRSTVLFNKDGVVGNQRLVISPQIVGQEFSGIVFDSKSDSAIPTSAGLLRVTGADAVYDNNFVTLSQLNTAISGIETGLETVTLTGSITGTSDSSGNITTTISNSSVTYAKIQNVPTQTLLGRGAAGTGVVSAITLGSGLTLSTAGVLNTTNTGSVTSVGLDLPNTVFTITNSPVTSTGNLTGSFINQAANTVLAGPITGVDNIPVFRQLIDTDIPALSTSKITSGIFDVARLGNGTASSTTFLRGDGSWSSLPTGTVYTGESGINISSGGIVTLDIDYTDAFYVNIEGDTMTGDLQGINTIMFGKFQSKQDLPSGDTYVRNFDLMTTGAGDTVRWSLTRLNSSFDFGISRFDDSNTYIDTPLNINRSSGITNIKCLQHSTKAISGTTIDMQDTSIQRLGNITSNTTYNLSNNGAGRMIQFSVQNTSTSSVTVTVNDTIMLGISTIPASSWAMVSIVNDGVNTFTTVVTQ